MTSQIIHLQETPSTNTYAKEQVKKGCDHGTIIWSDNQSSGRGRLGKDWQSTKGKGLYCSIIYNPSCGREEYGKITLVAGLAVAEVLEELTGLQVMLKWPNDIYIDGKKCGGILCEAVLDDKEDVVVIGIGINVLHQESDFIGDVGAKATSLALQGCSLSVDTVLTKVSAKVMELCDDFCSGGWSLLLKRWQGRDFLTGKESEWLLNNGTVKVGQAQGVSEEGLLYIVTDDGVRHQVLSGDVQLKGKLSI